MSDWIKAPVILLAHLLFAPLLGWLIRDSRRAQGWVFGLMVFMTSWHINKITLMLGSIEWYRGHTKGFEFSLIEILALALLTASWLKRGPGWKFWAPASWLWLAYCAASWVSVVAAPEKLYAVMAGVRFTKAVVLFLAAWHFIREEDDLRFMLRWLAVTLAIQAVVVLKMKYLNGMYQVRGWFEHQNPLAMWAYLSGLPLLAAAMSAVPWREGRWYAAGFAASAVIVQSSLSRASLVMFAAGTVAVVGLSLLERVTGRRLMFVAGLGLVATLGLALTMDTIIARFHDEGNTASGETRDVMNLASRAMLEDSAVGIGWNNFGLTINPPFPYGDVIDEWERNRGHRVDPNYAKGVVESHYWLLLAETGYAGCVTYLLFIGVTTWWCFRGMWRGRGELGPAFLRGLFVGLVLIYFHSSLERVLTQTKNLSLWFLLLGAAARLETIRRERKLTDRGAGALTGG